jgi:adenylate cyclase
MTSRKLATVLFTDIVGSTERLAELGDARWSELLDRNRRMVRAQIEHFGGREVTTTGDGFLVVFDEPGPAIRCAVAMRDAARPLEIAVRTGVHTGEIEEAEDGDVHGIAVHLGARVMAEAEPGEILVTGTVKELVQGADFRFVERGVRQLAGVPDRWPLFAVAGKGAPSSRTVRPARSRLRWGGVGLAVAVVILVGYMALWGRRSEAPEGEGAAAAATDPAFEHSIAVLPLDNLSPDPDNAYFSGAMTEEITSALSKVPGLRVVSRTSAQRYANSDTSIPEIAEELGVSYVLEGSARRAGEEVAIVVQLIDAATDEHVWTQRYERSMEDVIGVQLEIAERIATELRSSFTQREVERILAGSTDDPLAYDLNLRASEIPWQDMDDREQAGALLREAVERDPDFAVAWLQLSLLYRVKSAYGDPAWADSSRMAMDRAIEAAKEPSMVAALEAFRALYGGGDPRATLEALRKAVGTNPHNPVLVTALALVEGRSGDVVAAVQWGLRALDLDPMEPGMWVTLGRLYGELALDDAAEEAYLRALELDPQDRSGAWHALLYLRREQGRYDEALALSDSLSLSGMNPAEWAAFVRLGAGDLQAARAGFEEAFRDRSWEDVVNLAPEFAYARFATGDTTGADSLVWRAEQTYRKVRESLPLDKNIAWILVQLAAVRGDAAQAAEQLRTYVELGGRNARGVTRPEFTRVRSDPEFRRAVEILAERSERDRRAVERLIADRR